MTKHSHQPARATATTGPSWGHVLAFVFCAAIVGLGLVLLYGVFEGRANTDSADGIVAGFEEQLSERRGKGSGGIVYRPLVEFVVDGKKHLSSSGTWSGSNYWSIGDHVPIRYERGDPGTAFLDSFFANRLGSFLLVAYGGLFLFFVVVGTFASSTTPSWNPLVGWLQFLAGQAFCLAFLVPGCVLLVVGIRQVAGTETVTGTVIRIAENTPWSSTYYRPIVEYEVDGKSYVWRDREWTTINVWHVGSKATVRYRTNHPEAVVNTTGFDRWTSAIMLLVCGMIPEIATIVYLLRRPRRDGRAMPA